MNRFSLRSMSLYTLLLICMSTPYANGQQEIPLWDGVAPGSEGFTATEVTEERDQNGTPNRRISQVSKPTLTVFPASTEKTSKAAVVICPGGGYGGLSFDYEGIEMAEWFAKRGVTAFVLKYRHGGGVHQHPVPLQDVQRAMRIVRENASEFGYESNRIGVMGFSAGGHLASSVTVQNGSGNESAQDPIDRQSAQPDFLILAYPVISMEEGVTHGGSRQNLLGENPSAELVELMSNDRQVTDATPPTFIVHATDDGAVIVENSLRFYRALVDHKVPAELHVFAEGGHGFGMRRKDVPIVEWPNLLENWLRSRGLIK